MLSLEIFSVGMGVRLLINAREMLTDVKLVDDCIFFIKTFIFLLLYVERSRIYHNESSKAEMCCIRKNW